MSRTIYTVEYTIPISACTSTIVQSPLTGREDYWGLQDEGSVGPLYVLYSFIAAGNPQSNPALYLLQSDELTTKLHLLSP